MPLCAQRPHSHAELKFCRAHLLVGMQSQTLWSSRLRDGYALLRSAERAFCKNAKPASARCGSRVWEFPTSILRSKIGVCIYRRTACNCYALLLNCQIVLRLLYWTYQKFSGRCHSDHTDNPNRKQALSYLWRSQCRVSAAPNDGRAWTAKHGQRSGHHCTE